MGIKHFFYWFKQQFEPHMLRMAKGQDLADIGVGVDNLMLDMNGIFHNSAQKVYQYGNHKPNPRLLARRVKPPRIPRGMKAQLKLFEDVCATVETIFKLVNPRKKIILCVDGPAPLSKQNQQRQRRFRSASEQDEKCVFNSNCITPGTKFMDYLTKYMDWYIRKRINEDPAWRKVQVIFSNEKAPGEGEHKCFRKGTLILLWNGSTKAVEEIKVGEEVIGDDGTPRKVTELVSGKEEMYEIIQNNAENYTVNKNHILSLQIADHKHVYWSEKEGAWIVGWYDQTLQRYKTKHFSALRDNEQNFRNLRSTKQEAYSDAMVFINTIKDSNVLDISVSNYLKLPVHIQKRLYGFRSSGVDWPEQKIDIDPYLLGLWLGDGFSRGPIIYTSENEIVQFLTEYCSTNDFVLKNKQTGYCITEPTDYRSRMMAWLKKYNLIHHKHIPKDYLVNNRPIRLNVLAGIVDTDGNVTKEGRLIRISQCLQHKQLVDDIVYLARSLGLSTHVRIENAIHKYNGELIKDNCYQITISGDLHQIPTRVYRKKCFPPTVSEENGRGIVVNKLRTSIKVKPVGIDNYYGFNTDGNHRFLLGDFTVTHNCINFIRYHGTKEDTYCIHGLDADLIMLALGTHMPNFYIIREDLYDYTNEFFCINIGAVREDLAEELRWVEQKFAFDPTTSINDFIFLCFMVGNDFLPHIPSIEIIERGIELIIEVYKEVGTAYGHITRTDAGRVQFLPKSLEMFLGTIGQHEKENFESKLAKKESFFPDPLLESCATQNSKGEWNVDIEKYKQDYFNTSFPAGSNEERLCHEYLEGMQWVLSYYTRGVPNWKWHFPYHYAPPASTLSKHLGTFCFPRYGRTIPTTPFQQLLCVLPPKSADLIPSPLCNLLTDESSPLREHCPEDFKIDLSGKRREWEGIVILPMVNFDLVRDCYMKELHLVDKKDIKRNVTGQSFVYEYLDNCPGTFRSYYGDIESCHVRTVMIDL